MKAEKLTITVTASDNARAFSDVLDDVLDALDALAKHQGISPDWRIVSLEKNSPAKITIGTKVGAAVILSLVTGMAKLEASPSHPFNTPVLKPVKRLAERIGKQAEEVTLKSTGVPLVRPTPQMAHNIGLVLNRGFYEVPSSIDGKLDIVNVHAAAKFSIFEEVDQREIRCRFPPALLDDVKRNIGKRVTAVGMVRYRTSTDSPVSVTVESIEPLDDGFEPKLFSETAPIDLMGGLSSEEYVRRLRDGD